MTDRSQALRDIAVGDIFHASAPNGASLICLAEKITDTTISARTVTNHFSFDFDRTTGAAEWDYAGRPVVTCTIDSVAKLPPKLHDVMLDLDREYGSGKDPPLSDLQKVALLLVWRLYPAHPLPMKAMDQVTIAKMGEPDDHELTLKEYQDRVLSAYMIPGPRE